MTDTRAQTPQEQAPQEQTPQEQTPQEQTPQEQTPQEQTPQEQTPQEQTPQEQTPEQHRPRRSLGSYTVDRRPLAIPAYRRLWLAAVVSAVGGSFSLIAVPTQLFTLTGSSATIAVSSAASFVALTATSLLAGALADVTDRRRLLLMAHWGQGATYALLWIQAVAGLDSVAVLLVLVACQGVSYGTIMTTMGAAVPRVVPPHLLPAATSLSSLVRYTGAVVGPLLAGVLIPIVGLGTLYLLDATALVVVVWAVFRLPPLPPAQQLTPADAGVHQPGHVGHAAGRRAARSIVVAGATGIPQGFRYLFTHRLLVAVLGVDLAAMVFGMPSALFPELAERAFGGPVGGGTALGLLYAAYPMGVFAMGLMSGTFTHARHHGAIMSGAAIAWGLTVVLFALAPYLWAALLALAAGGAVNFLLSTFRNAITQAATDDALRGRIQGSLTVVLIGGPQTANLLHGFAGAALGARITIGVGGLLTMLAVALILLAAPQLRRYQPD
jgi:MFS family permease